MGLCEFFGYLLISFGAPLSIFLLFIVSDPMRIILFIGGAFVYLSSLLCTSILWYSIPGMDSYVIVTILLFVMFQELFRYGFYVVLNKAKKGLESVTVRGQPVLHIHSLKNAQHTIAFVTGTGFGVMAGVISMLNMLAAISGPGTIGLPTSIGLIHIKSDEKFFLYSAICAAALMLLHIMWNVVFWHGCLNRNWAMVSSVIGSHLFCACISLLNQKNLQVVTVVCFYTLLVIFTGIAYISAGGSRQAVGRFFKRIFSCTKFGQQPPTVVDVRM